MSAKRSLFIRLGFWTGIMCVLTSLINWYITEDLSVLVASIALFLICLCIVITTQGIMNGNRRLSACYLVFFIFCFLFVESHLLGINVYQQGRSAFDYLNGFALAFIGTGTACFINDCSKCIQ